MSKWSAREVEIFVCPPPKFYSNRRVRLSVLRSIFHFLYGGCTVSVVWWVTRVYRIRYIQTVLTQSENNRDISSSDLRCKEQRDWVQSEFLRLHM